MLAKVGWAYSSKYLKWLDIRGRVREQGQRGGGERDEYRTEDTSGVTAMEWGEIKIMIQHVAKIAQ